MPIGYVEYDNVDEASVFGGHHPDETDSNSTIGDYVAAALSDVGVPTYGFSILSQMVEDASDGVVIYSDNDLYNRNFTIKLSGDTEFMDWYNDYDGGYCVEVFVDNADNTVSDNIEVNTEMTISIHYYADGGWYWGSVFTDTVNLEVDLAEFK